jgi:hypothetical protein
MDMLTKDKFLIVASWVGLDIEDNIHMEHLYGYVRSILATISKINELDIDDSIPLVGPGGIFGK